MKLLNLREFDCCPYTTLFVGTDSSPEVDEMRKIIIDQMRNFEYSSVDLPSDAFYVRYHSWRSEEVRDNVREILSTNGYVEFEPKEIQIGD